jgi:CRP/FNR family transcriptional regulator, cyclic AMP receptor protein
MTEINLFRNARDVVDAAPGTVLFREGDAGDTMFAVLEGEVDLSIAGNVIDTVHAGEILGEMALVDHAPRSATATMRTQGRIARINEREFVFLVHEHPTFALQVMKILAERIRRSNAHA